MTCWQILRQMTHLLGHLLGHLLLLAILVAGWLMGVEKPSGLTGLKGCRATSWLLVKLLVAACAC